MRERDSLSRGGYYFALPRLCALLRGHDAERSENNWAEAYVGGVAVYGISCAMLIAQARAGALLAIAFFCVAWIGWVVVLYLNSVVVRGLRRLGIFHNLANPRAQNVIIGVESTACALALTMHPQWQMLGWGWLLLVAGNTAAAVLLHLWKPRDA
jgi:hypothetical protein